MLFRETKLDLDARFSYGFSDPGLSHRRNRIYNCLRKNGSRIKVLSFGTVLEDVMSDFHCKKNLGYI